MKLGPTAFDSILATGDVQRSTRLQSKPDVFGVRSLKPPTRGKYASLEEAIESLRKAAKGSRGSV